MNTDIDPQHEPDRVTCPRCGEDRTPTSSPCPHCRAGGSSWDTTGGTPSAYGWPNPRVTVISRPVEVRICPLPHVCPECGTSWEGSTDDQ